MGRLIIQILFFLHAIILIYSAEHEIYDFRDRTYTNDKVYDLNALYGKSLTRFQNSRKLENEPEIQRFNHPDFGKILFDSPGNTLQMFQNSSRCLDDLLYTVESLTQLKDASKQWALQMFDSYGKPDSGILQGSLKWPGDYSECVQIYAPPKPNSTAGDFHGKYCSLTWSLNLGNLSLSMTSGVCIPSTCLPLEGQTYGHTELKNAFSVLNGSNSIVNVTKFTCKPVKRTLNNPAKSVIALLSVICTLTLLGSSITAVKYFVKSAKKFKAEPVLIVNDAVEKEQGNQINSRKLDDSDDELLLQNKMATRGIDGILEMSQNFLECFCIFRNGAKILNTNTVEGELLSIHGIRFLSMSWVILGHTYSFFFTETRNILETMKLVDNFPFQIVLQGLYSVDSFFVLSGFLLSYLVMKEFAKNEGAINWPYFYIHRYIRLTPVYMVILGFFATVFLYLGSGPFWPDGDLDLMCKDSWWRNLLYINNFDSMNEQCMGWSWYLANDMQFFIISPIFLISLWRWPIIGYIILAIFMCATCLANFFITYHFDLPPGIAGFIGTTDMTAILAAFTNYFDKLYIKPYARIGPYLVGIAVGYILFRREKSKAPKHNWIILCFGWIIASSLTLTVVYGLYRNTPSLVARSFYNALNRTLFAIGLSWVIYVCLIGQGAFINSLLSFKLFIPLSRLTYVAYLIHPMIITGYFASLKTAFQFSHPTMVILFLGMMVITYALALPVALILESPVISLEKLVRKSLTKAQTN